MRSLKDIQLLTPVLIDADFPDGAIINETVSQDGTAVINEVYNDYIANFLALLKSVGDTTNGIADSEATTYQLLAAIQKTQNKLTGVRQAMTLASTTFTIPIAIDYLLDKTIMVVKSTGVAIAATTYSFKGTGALTYDLVAPNGFNTGDTVLLIINKPGLPVQAFSLTQTVAPSSFVTLTAADILGADPFFYLPLSSTIVPQYPKYLTMYVKNGDGDNQSKMIFPAYIADTRIIQGMPNPADWPSLEVTLYFS